MSSLVLGKRELCIHDLQSREGLERFGGFDLVPHIDYSGLILAPPPVDVGNLPNHVNLFVSLPFSAIVCFTLIALLHIGDW